MNREMRRKFNKKHKTNYSREEFSYLIAQERIRHNIFDFSDLDVPHDFAHMDNEEVAPEGCLVKLNYDAILSRPQNQLTQDFKDFIEENKDKELHLTREGSENSLVCIKEDHRVKIIDGKEVVAPRYLFDLFTDLLIFNDNEWHTANELEEKILNNKDEGENSK